MLIWLWQERNCTYKLERAPPGMDNAKGEKGREERRINELAARTRKTD